MGTQSSTKQTKIFQNPKNKKIQKAQKVTQSKTQKNKEKIKNAENVLAKGKRKKI